MLFIIQSRKHEGIPVPNQSILVKSRQSAEISQGANIIKIKMKKDRIIRICMTSVIFTGFVWVYSMLTGLRSKT
jgi:hypothetical protein